MRTLDLSTANIQSVFVSEGVLREAFAGVDLCIAIVLPTRSGAGRIVRVAFEELFDPASETDEEALRRIALMLPQTLSALFGPYLKQQSSTSRDDYYRERVKEFVRGNLRDPQLNTSRIARGVGLPLRRLHELFASEPETIMR